jgi:hypothetical protein
MRYQWTRRLWILLLLAFSLLSTGCLHYQHLKRSECSLGLKPVIVNPHWVEVVPNVWGVEAILLTLECKL